MPSVLVIGGANGAGKSTIAPPLISAVLGEAEFVNADAIARGLAGSRYAEVEFEAGRIFLRRIRKLAEERKDFAFESTLSSRSFAPFLRELREAGYTFHLAFVWVGSAESSAPASGEPGRGGRPRCATGDDSATFQAHGEELRGAVFAHCRFVDGH